MHHYFSFPERFITERERLLAGTNICKCLVLSPRTAEEHGQHSLELAWLQPKVTKDSALFHVRPRPRWPAQVALVKCTTLLSGSACFATPGRCRHREDLLLGNGHSFSTQRDFVPVVTGPQGDDSIHRLSSSRCGVKLWSYHSQHTRAPPKGSFLSTCPGQRLKTGPVSEGGAQIT